MGWINKNVNEDVANYLFNIKLDCLPDRIGVYQRDVRPDVEICFENLEQQLQDTPEMLAFWDLLLAEQRALRARLERKRDTVRAYVRKTIIKDCNDKGLSLTRDDIKEIINADKDLIEYESRIITETRKEERVRAVVKTLQNKSEHLRSLAGFKREEQRHTR